MTNLRKRLTFVALALSSVSGAAAALAACSSDDSVGTPDGGTPEGGGTDSPSGDTGTDGGTDASPDTFVPVDAGSLSDFIKFNAEATCARIRDCCGPATFDDAKCLGVFKDYGWNGSLSDLTVSGVATGGKVTYDPAAGTECLTSIRNIQCVNTPVAVYKTINDKCFAAAKGTAALASPCRSNAECVPTAYCDLTNADAGVCTALKATGAECAPAGGECAYREGPGPSRCLDVDGNGTYNCGPTIPNGQACGVTDYDCASGSCFVDPDGGNTTCENKANFLQDGCALFKKDGG